MSKSEKIYLLIVHPDIISYNFVSFVENGKIIKVHVKIAKSKNGLFETWYIYM